MKHHFIHIFKRLSEVYLFTQESSPFIGTLSLKQSIKQGVMRLTSPYKKQRDYIENNIHLNDKAAPLRKKGYMPIEQLNSEEVDALQQLYLNYNADNKDFIKAKENGTEIDSIKVLQEHMLKNDIQRSYTVTSNGNDKISELWRKESNITIAQQFLQIPRKELNGMAFIDNLSYVESKTEFDNINALSWHRDSDHYRFLKIFYFLTDCEEGQGHHEYMSGTHRILPFKLAPLRNYHESELKDVLPNIEKVIVTGTAGKGFAEDTFGFHRGTPFTKPGSRLLMQLIYYPNDVSWGEELTPH
ncbi:MAG: hypothetical protein ACJA0H_000056 [Francisellaceae bacterium]|jgi:hypothetical protein